jgi:hypothetical protein
MNNLEPKTFFFELPIYTPIRITPENQGNLNDLVNFSGTIDYYNPTLGENTTYKVYPIVNNDKRHFLIYGGWAKASLECVRTKETFHVFYFLDESKVIKIGQYPSIADFHIAQIKNYKNVLSKERLREFTRAIGLAANGIGIGSFVYLRRIFEDLIEEAHQKSQKDADWDAEAYSRSRMADRIDLLKAHLPSFLVEHKSLYGILSVGIHSLKEDECLAYFETVKTGIELILDEKQEAFEKQRKLDQAKQKIAALSNQIKGQQAK